MLVQPYLHFGGRCKEALAFYAKTLGAKVAMVMHYKDSPDPTMVRPGMEDLVMHSTIQIGESTLMMSDGECSADAKFSGFSLSLTPATEAEAKKLFDGLVEGGKVMMPLMKTFFSPCFGMVADRFGMHWIIMVPGAPVRAG